MRRRYVWIFVCLIAAVFAFAYHRARAQSNAKGLRVNESATRVWLKKEKTQVALAVENTTGAVLPLRITLEWLDQDGNVENRVTQAASAAIGTSTVTITAPLSEDGEPVENDELLWYRLRYRVTAAANHGAALEGMLALSELAADLFDLRVIAGEYPLAGKRYQAHVIALHPLNGRPVRNVRASGEIMWDGEAAKPALKASAVTNGEGLAVLSFQLPRAAKIEDGELRVTGELGESRGELEVDLRDEHLSLANVMIQTDKPLYQPGQAVHTRALIWDFGRQALPDTPVSISIEDPEGATVFETETRSSRFGVASADWTIPANARLGKYWLIYEINNEQHDSQDYRQPISISRYDLPNFAVTAQAERGYYLPGEDATVKLRADYLFGQPVKRARVRLVRETEREWNYHAQKWEAEEEEVATGATDETGAFTATIKLVKQHEDLKANTYARFRDHSYAAYVTDATSGRTEQRRFDVRVTREAIHLYVIDGSHAQVAGQPLRFYLSASYADGTPAACEVQINQLFPAPYSLRRHETPLAALRKLKTNKYGLAKVEGLAVNEQDNDKQATLQFTVRDGQGRVGELTEDLRWSDAERNVRITPNKSLYRAGEPLELTLTAAENATVILSVTRNLELVHSQSVRLRKGRSFVVVPYRAEFKDELTIAVQGYAGDDGSERLRGSRGVMYPRDNELKLDVRLAQTTYRPGETASAALRVTLPDGKAAESVLGISVVDQAVLERARTNEEFGQRRGHSHEWSGFLAGQDSLAGVSKRDLSKLDLTAPLPKDLALLAEILLRGGGYEPRMQGGGDLPSALLAFHSFFSKSLDGVDDAMRRVSTGNHPANLTRFQKLLSERQIKLADLLDPWEKSLRADFNVEQANDVLRLRSAGPDKRFDTADDFIVRMWHWAYFKPTGALIESAVQQLYARTGFVTTDVAALQRELAAEGMNLAALRDRWGNAYRLSAEIFGRQLRLSLMSSGPDGAFDTASGYDDFVVWNDSLDYFAHVRQQMEEVLNRHFRKTGNFPQSETEWQAMLATADIDAAKLRDAWGHAYEMRFQQRIRFSPNVTVHYREYEQAKQQGKTAALSQQTNFIILFSRGADGVANTPDDFELADFSRLVAEAVSQQFQPQAASHPATSNGASGAISGLVTDASGAVIPRVTVTARHRNDSASYEATTDENGKYTLLNLPTGIYEVKASANGFKAMMMTEVPVQSTTLVEINITLEVGSTTETVTVMADSPQLQTESASVSSKQVASLKLGTQIATPRLREYFPETLLWQPSLETDRAGRAQLQFKLADNITTWRLSAIASTPDGQLGLAEADIRAFQPFFIEHDPPRVLTEGDEISLPVTLRNYLPRRLALTSTMQAADWFTLLNPAPQRTEVAAGEAGHAVFNLRATAAIENGKQRVMSLGAQASDAIEKPVTVHPDGEEVLQTASDIFAQSAKLNITIPPDAIKGSVRAELKLYPNLLAHVFEGIEGILKRPYGCGEQTISSTYPNLLALRFLSRQSDESSAPAQAKARKYLQDGYERLLGYRTPEGGIGYWNNAPTDLALTGYALRFLNDAAALIAVDESVTQSARAYLLNAQQADGGWASYGRGDEHYRLMVTAFLTRTLADAQRTTALEAGEKKRLAEALAKALAYLRQQSEASGDAYVLAQYALALQAGGDTAQAERPLTRLRALMRKEGDTGYWQTDYTTPFYGWGLAGRIETTALAVRALNQRAHQTEKDGGVNIDWQVLVQQGLLYLLRQQDRYGVWHTTQATVAVHEVLAGFSETEAPFAETQNEIAEVFVNQQPAGKLTLPAARKLGAPLTLDLARFVTTGAQTVEIRRASKRYASAQLVTSHYQPWSAAKPTDLNRLLRLAVNFDQTQFKLGGAVTCRVEAERITSNGGGMLLAEIGLPPGAEVERASLEQAKNAPQGGLNQYDILPDRVVLYLWPRAGGVKLSFKFRPRFGIKAQSAPSLIYDYYNPAARMAVPPTRFIVQ